MVLAATLLPTYAMATPANPSLSALINGINDGAEQPDIVLSELTVSIDQHGNMAEIQIDALLTNPSDNEVEARFTMQLPRDAVLTGYQLDIDGVMIPGSLIDQPKAQQIYEDEVRGNIDPGLAEISTRNEFSTRIYPVSPEGSRRISLTFVTPVDIADGLSLPLESVGPVGVFRLNASVSGVSNAPVLALTNGSPVEFVQSESGWEAAGYTLSETRLSGALHLSGVSPISDAMASLHSNGRRFFTITDQLAGINLTEEPAPHIRVYWDVSRSRADALLDEERNLLARFLRDLAPDKIEVVRFASAQPLLTRFDGDAPATVDAMLSSTSYRGATSFAGIDEVTDSDADLCLMFSDGGRSLDQSAQFEADCPLIIIASGPNIDAQKVGRLADDNGGMALFLDAQNTTEILEQMKRLPVGLVSIRDAGGNRLNFRTLPAGNGQWSVVGELSDWDEFTVQLSGTSREERRRTYLIDTARAGRNDAAGALWAAQEVARLSDNPADSDAMQALARSFQVASPTMAFLVLERPDQYVAAKIEPPHGFGQQWLEKYRIAKNAHDENRETERERRLQYVLSEWDETRRWWSAQYDQERVMQQNGQSNEPRNGQEAAQAAGDAQSTPPPPTVLERPQSQERLATTGESTADAADGSYSLEADDTITVTATRREVGSLSPASAVPVAFVDAEGFSGTPNEPRATVQVSLANVLSERSYLEALEQAQSDARLRVLAEQEVLYGTVPGFYFDVAEWFRLNGDAALGRQLLLSALDLPTSDDETLLIVAFRLERDGDYDTAIELLETLAARIDYRTQPKRILALALAARARSSAGAARRNDLERAFELLSEVVFEPTDTRYAGLETVALMEINSLIPLIDQAGGTWTLDERLVAIFDTDLRVVVEWTSADADLDLWVAEPSGEQAHYGNQRTALGGKLSNDMTDGYGPEEYVLKNAYQGDYQVRVQGFSGDRINPNGPGRAMVRLIRNFARGDQSEQLIDAEVGFDRSNQNENDRVVATIQVED